MSISTRWAQAVLWFVLALGSGGAFAEQYRFEWGPHPEGAANPAACAETAQPWYPTPEEACQGTKAVHPACDRRSATYRNHVATLLANRIQCHVSWEYQNIGSDSWGHWSATPGLSFCSTDPRCATKPSIALWAPSVLSVGQMGTVTIQVTHDRAPVAGVAVSATATSGLLDGCSAATDSGGAIFCQYIAPSYQTTATIKAECAGCVQPAVASVPIADNSEPESCLRDENGKAVGNPILPATGEKRQVEHDFADPGAHALNLTRTYRSWWANAGGNPFAAAGLGGAWTHNHLARLVAASTSPVMQRGGAAGAASPIAVVHTGQGDAYFFWTEGAWRPFVGADALQQDSFGWTYKSAADDSVWRFTTDGALHSRTARNGWAYVYGYANGRLAEVTNAFGRKLLFNYDGAGQLAWVTTPDGATVGYTYESTRLASVTYPAGAQRHYLHKDGRWPSALTGIVDEAGNRWANFAYDTTGRAVLTEYAGGANRFLVNYAGSDAATVTDPLNTSRTYSYGRTGGRLSVTASTLPSGSGGDAAARQQNEIGLVLSETDFLGVQTFHTWDSTRQVKVATTQAAGRPEEQTTSIEWHSAFRLPVRITEPGRTTAYSYDNFGNTLSETITDTATGQARTWAWTYNAQGLPDSMTDPKGGVWKYGYDSAGNRISSTNPLGEQTSYSYDAAGRVTSQTEPNGLVTRYSYDMRGRLVSQERAGEVSSYSYTRTGQLAAATLPNGFQASYSYDAAQRLIGASDNRGNSVSYTLDAMGNRVREEVKDATGAIALVTARIINSLNKVAAIQGAAGQTTQLAYDANGESIAQTDPLNQTTRQTLDGLRRPTATTFPDNASAQQAWNGLDQLTQVTDPKGVATSYQTNAFGEVMSETSPDIGTLTYTRDASGEVTSIQDAKGQITHISRDALGRPTEIHYASHHAAFFQYDAGGHVTRIEDKSGATAYERDAQGRMLAKTQSVNDNPANPTQLAISYGYQAGDLASIGYPSGLKVFYQRSAGRITGIQVQEPPNRSSKTPPLISFVGDLTHTALGQPKSWTWNSGDAASRSFDTDGRMSANEFASYIFDAAGRITGITQRLWAQRAGQDNGRNRSATELYQAPISWTAGYDARNRLTSFTRAGAETQYSYDANSNRLTALETRSSEADLDDAFDRPNHTQSSSQSLNIDPASNKLLGFTQTVTHTRPSGQSSVTSQVNYSLDANGAMTSDGLRTFEYDESRRLAKVKLLRHGEAETVQYLHNAIGQRVFKSEPQAERRLPREEDFGPGFMDWLKNRFGWMFVRGNADEASIGMAFVYGDSEIPNWALLGEYDNGSAQGKGRTEYIWLPTDDGQAIPIGMYKNGKFYAVHSDHLGTPRLITDEDKKPVWQWSYSAFGNNKPTGVLAATTKNGQATLKATKPAVESNQRYPGQYFDEESNFSENGFRSYGPSGRYTQPDPIGLAGGLNRFAYVEGNPLSKTDPTGLIVEICKRTVDVDWLPRGSSAYLPRHNWLKTDSTEVGMGAACVVGQGCSDRPGDKTYTKDHRGQSSEPGASCTPVPDVDEQCVNRELQLGRYLGRWHPMNQCQSFAQEVIEKCTNNGMNKPYIGYPKP